ncbi:MAG: hypothetical protein RMX68_002415 [Aulosira sp. ZfuVER01]|nr:hypothetical protein [Aulosira sp. ZfuVER01]MDZ7996554.1 hypothetical protein [Aulosira sp. DedVER01a]MDZ8054465.1 hypothetical protein [Aulosira sp. ZfuCHP01]
MSVQTAVIAIGGKQSQKPRDFVVPLGFTRNDILRVICWTSYQALKPSAAKAQMRVSALGTYCHQATQIYCWH